MDKKIEEFSEELFTDLGLSALPEEQKADIYARLQQHLHKVITMILSKVLSQSELEQLYKALEQENYRYLRKVIKKYPQLSAPLEEKIRQEFDNLKSLINKEQSYA